MDYSKLSDFEIDKAVADALGINYDIAIMFVNPVDKINGNHVEEYIRKKITSNEKHWRRFSPTRIPNDAWPIIIDNQLSLNNYGETWEASFEHDEPVGAFGTDECVTSGVEDKNPLRTLMIAFLMKVEIENAKIPTERDS